MRNSVCAALLLVLVVGSAVAGPAVETLRWQSPETGGALVAVPYYHLPPLPEPDFAWGFYFDYNRLPEKYRTDDYVRLCMRQMAQAGMNTVTLYGAPDVAARHLRIAIGEGLVGKQPVMVLGAGPAGSKLLQVANGAPELIGYGPDEPKPEDAASVAESVAGWHKVGLRCATAIKAESLNAAGAPLDIWIINARGLDEKCLREGRDLWMYECRFRGTNYDLHRYWTGIYSYAMHRRYGVKACWTWGYVHDPNSEFHIANEGRWAWRELGLYEHALPGPEGPIGTVGLDGMAAGVADFKVLAALEGSADEFLDVVAASVESHFWAGTSAKQVPLSKPDMWDLHDTAVPLVNVDRIMRSAVRLLLATKAGY
jgi:hypothetical protein